MLRPTAIRLMRKLAWTLASLLFAVNCEAASPWAKACQNAWDEKNVTGFVEYCKKGADDGDPKSQYYLGSMYAEGIGVVKDLHKAATLWLQSAAAGVPEAQHNVGRLYQQGIDVEQNYTKALEWYEKAANQGDTFAMHNIGFFYQKGQGVPVDYKKAEDWYGKAAAKGLANSQYNLAVMYFNGVELPKDVVRAYAWLLLAQDGYSQARNDLPAVARALSNEQKERGRALSQTLLIK